MRGCFRTTLAAGLSVFVALAIGQAALAATLDPLYTADFVFDDAYYYLQVAYNIANGAGSSFDGITTTNGYHPLWMTILVGVELLFGLDKQGLFVALILISYSIAIASVLLGAARVDGPLAVALSVGLLCSYATYPGVWRWGLETVLLAPVVVWFALISRWPNRRARDLATVLVLLYCVCVRADALSFVVAYSAVAGFLLYRREGMKAGALRALTYLVPTVAYLLGYFAFNQAMFGIPVPVSGVAKSLGAPLFSNWPVAIQYLAQSKTLIAMAVFTLLLEKKTKAYERDEFFYPLIAALFLSMVVQCVYYVAFSGWRLWDWYFYNNALLLTLLCARIVYICLTQSNAASSTWVSAASVALVFVTTVAIPAIRYGGDMILIASEARNGEIQRRSFNRDNIRSLRSDFDGSDSLTIAMGDRSGGLGYWAPETVHVFQTEGLVSSVDYLRARKSATGVEWILDNVNPDLLIVDRGRVPLLGQADSQQYVVVEPIQGWTVADALAVFCFPPKGMIRSRPNHNGGVRMEFDVQALEPCTSDNAAVTQGIIEGPIGIRRYSLPHEY